MLKQKPTKWLLRVTGEEVILHELKTITIFAFTTDQADEPMSSAGVRTQVSEDSVTHQKVWHPSVRVPCEINVKQTNLTKL